MKCLIEAHNDQSNNQLFDGLQKIGIGQELVIALTKTILINIENHRCWKRHSCSKATCRNCATVFYLGGHKADAKTFISSSYLCFQLHIIDG